MNPRRRRHRRIARKQRRAMPWHWMGERLVADPVFVDKIRNEYAAEINDYVKRLS